MKARVLTSPLFLFVVILMLVIPNVNAVVDNQVGTFSRDGVGAFNPNYINVYDPNTEEVKGYVAYAYVSGSAQLTLKVWSVLTGTEVLTTQITTQYAYPFGIAIYQTNRLGAPYDGFYLICVTANGLGSSGSYAYDVEGYFINMTTLSVSTLGRIVLQSSSGMMIYETAIFSNIVYTTGKDVMFVLTGFVIGSPWKLCLSGVELTPTTMNVYSLVIQFGTGVTDSGLYGLISAWVCQHFSYNIIYNAVVWSYTSDSGYYIYGKYLLGSGWSSSPSENWLTGQTSYTRKTVLERISEWRKQGFYKFKGLQINASSWPESYFAFWSYCDKTSGETYMLMFQTDHVKTGSGAYTVKPPVISTYYKIPATAYSIDLQGATTSITDNYYYDPSGVFYSAGIYEDGPKSVTITLAVNPNPDTYIFSGYGYFYLNKAQAKITIWVRAQMLPTVYQITPPGGPGGVPTNPEQPGYVSTALYTAVGIALPLMFMFVPALILGEKAGTIGLIVGLGLGGVVMYLGGLIPIWVVILLGLGLVALIFFGRGRFL